jgi:integrase
MGKSSFFGTSPHTLTPKKVSWHSFRHTFRTLLDETGAPMKVQQELMRHADIRTTMNVYGKAMDASKREAHSKVVRMVLAAKVA